jgi:hypothetical protein
VSPGVFGQPNSSFYVSTAGDDLNPGTQTAPLRTVQHVAETARAGSTVNVPDGFYEELVSINASGNASAGYITFRSYKGETAIRDATHFTLNGRSGILTSFLDPRFVDPAKKDFHLRSDSPATAAGANTGLPMGEQVPAGSPRVKSGKTKTNRGNTCRN